MNLDVEVMKSLDNMELNVVIRALVEFTSKTLDFSWKVSGLLHKELKDGDKAKITKDLPMLQEKYDKDKAAWLEECKHWRIRRSNWLLGKLDAWTLRRRRRRRRRT